MLPTTNRDYRKGFTLIEIMVVVAIFGLIMVAGTLIYLSIVQEYNRNNIRNEVRQNAERVMNDMGAEIRKSYSWSWDGTTLKTYLDSQSTPGATYSWNPDGFGSITKSGNNLLAPGVSAFGCTGANLCSASCSVPGISLSPSDGSQTSIPAAITLTVQQTPSPTRSDFCGTVTLTDTFYPRNAP